MARRAGLAISVALALAACKDSRPVVSIRVAERPGIGVDRAAYPKESELSRLAEAAIAPLGFERRAAKPKEVPWQVELVVQLTAEPDARAEAPGGEGEGRVFRAVTAALSLAAQQPDPSLGGIARVAGQASVEGNYPRQEGFDRAIDLAIQRAGEDLGIAIAIQRAGDGEVVAKVRDPDPRVRARAIDQVSTRRLKAAVDPLITVLSDEAEEPDVVLKAIGALIAIGDRRGVGPLIDSARRGSPAYLRQIIFGVAQIGGKEAEAYLFTVASGHPDPEIRSDAQDALRELEQAEAAKTKAIDAKPDDS
jgi:hypothetical protein